MATVNFLYRSTRPISNLTIRLLFRHSGKDYVFSAKTKIRISKNDFLNRKSNSRDPKFRSRITDLNSDVGNLERHVLMAFQKTKPLYIDKGWLQGIVDDFYDPEPEKDERVIFWIQNIIDHASSRENAKGGLGLSKSRIQAWKRLLCLFDEFSNGRNYKVSDINISKFKEYRSWLIDEKAYQPSYATKKLADLKTVLRDARNEGIPVSLDFEKLPAKQAKTYDDDMDVIYLTNHEIQKIESLELDNDSLINARKWLILACNTGQRGTVLTEQLPLTKPLLRPNGDRVLLLVQKKGNKPVEIPVSPKTQQIYDEGFPYKVSTQKLNKHFKTLGRLAKIDEPVVGKIEERIPNLGRRKIKKSRPKWKYIGTHIGRRTFAMTYYGQMHTPDIMKVTGHSREDTFLKYVNKSGNGHIASFMKIYQNEEQEDGGKNSLSIA